MRYVRALCLAVTLVAATAALPATAPPAEAQTCILSPTGGPVDVTIGQRAYVLHVPTGIPGPQAMLVISLHGWTPTIYDWRQNQILNQAADQYKFIVAHPQGRVNPINRFPVNIVPYWGWDPLDSASPDIQFIVDVVEHVSASYCIDPAHIHVEGVSMGGAMAQRMGCARSDLFASGVAHVSADIERPFFGMASDPCALARPVSMRLSCTENDSFLGLSEGGYCQPRVDAWADRLGCGLPPARTTDTFGWLDTFSGCDAGTRHSVRMWNDVGHNYPAGPGLAQYLAEMVQFFQVTPLAS